MRMVSRGKTPKEGPWRKRLMEPSAEKRALPAAGNMNKAER